MPFCKQKKGTPGPGTWGAFLCAVESGIEPDQTPGVNPMCSHYTIPSDNNYFFFFFFFFLINDTIW